MPDSTLHSLTDGAAPAASDEFYIVRHPHGPGDDYKLTWAELLAAAQSGLLMPNNKSIQYYNSSNAAVDVINFNASNQLVLSTNGSQRMVFANDGGTSTGTVSALASNASPSSSTHVRLGDGSWNVASSATGNIQGISFLPQIHPSSSWALSSIAMGAYLAPSFYDNLLSGNVTGDFRGLHLAPAVQNTTRSLTAFYGMFLQQVFAAAGAAITNVQGIAIGGPSVTQPVTNYTQFRINSPSVGTGGSISSLVGLKVADLTASGAGTIWGLSVDGLTMNNYIQGKLSIGKNTAPTVALDVTGDFKITGDATVRSIDTSYTATLDQNDYPSTFVTTNSSSAQTATGIREKQALLLQAIDSKGGYDYANTGTGTILVGSLDTLTAVTGTFTSDMVGLDVIVRGAGAAGAEHKTKVASFVSSSVITLTDPAITAVTGAIWVAHKTSGGIIGYQVGAIHGQSRIAPGLSRGSAQTATFESISLDHTADGQLIALEATVFSHGQLATGVDSPTAKIALWLGSRGSTADAQMVIAGAVTSIQSITNVGGKVRVTMTGNHVFHDNDIVVISGVTGTGALPGYVNNTAATGSNPTWTITVTSANSFELVGSAYPAGTYTAATGTAVKYYPLNALVANVQQPASAAYGIRLRSLGGSLGGATPTATYVQLLNPSVAGGVAIDIPSHTNWASDTILLPNAGAISGYTKTGASLYKIGSVSNADQVILGDSGAVVRFAGHFLTLNNFAFKSFDSAGTQRNLLYLNNTSPTNQAVLGDVANPLVILASNVSVGNGPGFGGGTGVIAIANATTDPTSNPASGGILYVSSGNIKFRSSSGAIYALGAPSYSANFDIHSTAATTVFTQSIPPNAIPSTGTVLITMDGAYTNSTGVDQTITLEIDFGGTILWGDVSNTIPTNGTPRSFALSAALHNGDQTTGHQRLADRIGLSNAVAGSLGGTGGFSSNQFTGSFGGTSAIDTTQAATLAVKVTLSGGSFTGSVHVQIVP